MNYRIFNIPLPDSREEEKQLNQFINSIRLISIQKELVQLDKSCFWSFVVEYIDKKAQAEKGTRAKIDYREILSAQDFAFYCKLRDLRKTIAEEEGLPIYAIFTNEQLATMITSSIKTKSKLLQISGIGAKKIETYGDRFLKELNKLK